MYTLFNHTPAQYEGEQRGKWDSFYKEIHQHFCNIILSEIKKRNENFVEYWPAFFFWGGQSSHKRGFMDDRTYLYKYGTFATGYLCLSDKKAYIVGLAKMTKQFPLFATGGTGFMLQVLGRMAGESDQREPIRNDKIWAINYDSMLAAEIAEDNSQQETLFVRTGVELWHINQHFTGTLEEMATGINMGISGKLRAIWSVDGTNTQPVQSTNLSAEVLELLKKLGELKDAGVLTETEFEQKKTDLLSRF